eukprot:842113_1
MTSEPRVVGTFEEYADFYRGNNAATYNYIVNLIRSNCGSLSSNAHILDIGCGGAFTIDLLQNDFKSISLVEPNEYFRSKWLNKDRAWINDGKHILHLYPSTIEEVIQDGLIAKSSLDAIIVYHPIYHFKLEILRQTIQSIVSYLKPDGVCIISVFDDNDKFAKIYRKVSPQYQLSANVEQILNRIPDIKYKKEHESNEYSKDWDDHLKFAKWLLLQDCMNQNYFPNGLSEEQLNAVHRECERFIQQYCTKTLVKADDGTVQIMYKNMYSQIHFVIKKKNHVSKL